MGAAGRHVLPQAHGLARPIAGPGHVVDAEAVRQHCAALIAKHKAPRYVWILDTPLPRNANGKFLKRELRETLSVADAG